MTRCGHPVRAPPDAESGQTRQAVPVPTPEQPLETDQPVREAVRAYAAPQPGLRAPTERFVELVTTLLDDAGINYLSVDGRTKSVASFAAKAARTVDGRPLYADPLVRDHRPDRRPRHHLRPQRRGGGRGAARRPADVLDDRDMGEETAQRGPLRLRQPAPAGRVPDEAPEPTTTSRPPRQHPGADRAAARVGGVRARHPLQGHRPGGARPRPRPPVHAGRRAARAGRPGVLHDPGAAPGQPPRPAPPTPTRPTRGSAARSWRRSWPGQYADAGWSHTDHYGWIAGLLLELGITSLDELAGAAHLGRPRRDHPPHGLPLPRRRRPPARRRPARDLRPAVRRAHGQRPPGATAARPGWRS